MLLAPDKEAEEEYPECAHGMPVPGSAVNQDLTGLDGGDLAQADDGCEEQHEAKDEMDAVDAGDEVEEARRLATGVENVLRGELTPCDDLSPDEGCAECGGGDEPGEGFLTRGAAEAKPFFHEVDLVEDGAARELHRDGRDEQHDRVEPEDARDGDGDPRFDVVVVRVDVAGVLGDEEGADDRHEEDEIACEEREDGEAVGLETFTRAATAYGVVVPVVSVATTAGVFGLNGWEATAADVGFVDAAWRKCLDHFIGMENGWHATGAVMGLILLFR